MSYGVTPQGFNRKPLNVILAEIEEAAIGIFGPALIQSAQSPMGQLNGLFANLVGIEWEHAEDAYQSYDPDQGEGNRLDMLAKLRLLERATAESDESFRLAITNAGRARIDMQDITRAVRGIEGVSFAQTFLNDTSAIDANGMDGHSVCVAVIGGEDDEIARVLRDYIVPGIGSYGNTRVDTEIAGFCRSLQFMRPVPVPIWLALDIRVTADRNGCPPLQRTWTGWAEGHLVEGQPAASVRRAAGGAGPSCRDRSGSGRAWRRALAPGRPAASHG
jgi:hypothetical protein